MSGSTEKSATLRVRETVDVSYNPEGEWYSVAGIQAYRHQIKVSFGMCGKRTN
ncbi:hypothetical protein PGT21_028703 [Puccinia graminis f. sp. tritici]|uniref:Uncharacterized protein n=1 Tax=Puccinia graminis f. sp. tritici TaxID=56615 RepID=A0A5B0R8G5_PUCGR|nr:hypothetical protein PGT21_028703 [Puccinia graminis f. sp. tritici]KAA1121588.1 hypothetical protein PGTUg99_032951 [Puccinia graminis f. sp. tritici]